MKRLIVRWLLSLRYHIDIEWVGHPIEHEMVRLCVWSLYHSQLDPLLLIAYAPTDHSLCIAAPSERITLQWIRRILNRLGWIPLAVFSDRVAQFFGRRLLRLAIPEFKKHPSEDWIVLFEGLRNPLPLALLKAESRRIVAARIDGLEGSQMRPESSKKPLEIKKAVKLILQNGIFWMPKRRIRIIFEDITDRVSASLSEEEFQKKWIEIFQRKREIGQPISDFFWKKSESSTDLKKEEKLLKEIARLAKRPVSSIDKQMYLYDDLMLDSLDVTELIVIIEKEFHRQIAFNILEKVQDVLDTAMGRSRFKTREQVIKEKIIPSWSKVRPPIQPPEGKTIGEAFLRSCDRMGPYLASTDPIESLSYARLKTLAVGFAEAAKKLPGTEIGVLIPPSGEIYAVIMGLILAGKTPVILNWSQGPYRIDQVLDQTNLQVILTTIPFLQHLPIELSDKTEEKMMLLEEVRASISIKEREEGLRLARLPVDALLCHFRLDQATGNEIAVIIFTSGTEKTPKGVPLSHHNLLSNQRAILEVVPFSSEDVLLGMLPLFHIYGFSLTGIFPLLIGLRVVYHPSPLDFQGVIRQIDTWKVTTLATVPTFLRGLLHLATSPFLDSLKLCVIGAEKPSLDLIHQVHEKLPNIQLMEGYGLTECSPVLTLKKAAGEEGVGQFLKGIESLIVDPETLKIKKEGQVGLILVRGPTIFHGYYNNSPSNPFVEIDGKAWFNTQDLGFLDSSNTLHLQGRQSRTVKIGGELISLSLLEEVILKAFITQLPSLQLAVVGEPDPKKGAHLVLFTNQSLTLEEVNHALMRAGVGPLLKIAAIEIVNPIPITALGKIDYQKLQRNKKDSPKKSL